MTDMDEVEWMFSTLGGCVETQDLVGGDMHARPILDHGSRWAQLRYEERTDATYRRWLASQSERVRAKKMASDAEYAARRKAQYRAAYERRRARLMATPESAEEQRRKWREEAAARAAAKKAARGAHGARPRRLLRDEEVANGE